MSSKSLESVQHGGADEEGRGCRERTHKSYSSDDEGECAPPVVSILLLVFR